MRASSGIPFPLRPCKKSWPSKDAFAYLSANKEKHFDPDCVNVFVTQIEQTNQIQQQFQDNSEPQPEQATLWFKE